MDERNLRTATSCLHIGTVLLLVNFYTHTVPPDTTHQLTTYRTITPVLKVQKTSGHCPNNTRDTPIPSGTIENNNIADKVGCTPTLYILESVRKNGQSYKFPVDK